MLAVLYAILMVLYRVGWTRQESFHMQPGYQPQTKISVIVPARNEECHIADCIRSLLVQDYPAALLEIIVVDDHSTDRTAEIIQSFSSVHYVELSKHTEGNVSSYKKLALATGIAGARGELIVTTDADCTAGTQWLKHIAALYERDMPVMIVAPVDFSCGSNTVQLFQSLDFMSMQGITTASLQLKLGNMCNGANLAFQRAAFDRVGGYKGVDHIASGDDYLLMMKLNKAYPNAISYLKSPEAIVYTPPQPDWKSFLQQRIRWASKSGKYDDKKMTAVLSFVYLFNLSFLLMLIVSLFHPGYGAYLLVMLVLKIVAELFYLYRVAGFFNKRKQLWLFPLLQPLHIVYIVIAGLLGFTGNYQWKGRSVK
ncbi:MAG: glycosyltransferase [Taibaiella sp.]|nr:glycosyltransferase [Taibaiella sp.]